LPEAQSEVAMSQSSTSRLARPFRSFLAAQMTTIARFGHVAAADPVAPIAVHLRAKPCIPRFS